MTLHVPSPAPRAHAVPADTDAAAWRAARAEGRVLHALPLAAVRADALARDRTGLDDLARSPEMAELVASIRARGQREPIEVWPEGDGFQLVSGWRRLAALRRLHRQTGERRFATVLARVGAAPADDADDDVLAQAALDRYRDMVEENTVRQDLTFSEMANAAIAAAADPAVDGSCAHEMVGLLFGALHKSKRSSIRAFVLLLELLGEELRWPKAVPRNLGVSASRAIRSLDEAAALRAILRDCRSGAAQNRALSSFVQLKRAGGDGRTFRGPEDETKASPRRIEMRIGAARVLLQGGECRIALDRDFTAMPPDRIERAVRAFQAEFGPAPRIHSL